MQKLRINLNLISDIKEFVMITSSINCDIDIVRGRYVIDGRSAMGIFTLDLSQPIDLIIHSDDENIAKLFDKWVIR